MKPRTYLLLGLAIGAVAAAVWRFAGEPAEPGVAADVPVSQPSPAISQVAIPAKPPVIAKKTTAQLVQDTSSGSAATRAAAIEALAEAPRAEALPVLGRILIDGEPQIDRVLALRSLRDLALNQGDADGAIRDAVRRAIYHGDDLTKVDDVQEALEIIEESLQARRDVSVSQR
jgi:UDP-N-acetylmuramyl pentapeptide synthase